MDLTSIFASCTVQKFENVLFNQVDSTRKMIYEGSSKLFKCVTDEKLLKSIFYLFLKVLKVSFGNVFMKFGNFLKPLWKI